MSKSDTGSQVPQAAKRLILKNKPDVIIKEIAERIDAGKAIASEFASEAERFISKGRFTALSNRAKSWHESNMDLLGRLFSDSTIVTDYKNAAVSSHSYGRLGVQAEHEIWECRTRVTALESLLEQIPSFDMMPGLSVAKASEEKVFGNKVCIVHGHDQSVKDEVSRFLEKMGVGVVILHEQANKGKALMEKFETDFSEADVGYAVVLLTSDDVGKHESDEGELSPRVCQDVILELGYFWGKLGRERVCALRYGNVELPTDIIEVVYIPFGSDNSWQAELAKRLKAVGFNIELDKVE